MSRDREITTTISKAKRRAGSVLNDPQRISKLLEASRKKMDRLELGEHELKGIMGTIKTFIRMLRAFRSGRYQAIPWVTILMIVSALIYFIMPLDMIPDFFPVTGYVDDFSIILAIYHRFKEDIVSFQIWESSINN